MRDFYLENDDTLFCENTPEIFNTDIGYNHEELKATPTDDLLVLRKAIFAYLKSPNLKKRNPNYLKLFRRLNEERKSRSSAEKDKFNKNKDKVFFKIFKFFSSIKYFYLTGLNGNFPQISLRRKRVVTC